MKKLFEEFKAFAFKGNVLDMAVGVMIASAFGKIVSSVVDDLFMPVLSLLTGRISFQNLFIVLGGDGTAYTTLQEAKDAGAKVLAYGNFISVVIDFLLIALCIFMLIKVIGKVQKKEEAPAEEPKPEPRLCPFCRTEIPEDAVRCPHCTSELK